MIFNLIGIGIFSLLLYIISILFINNVLKRKMAECIFFAYLGLVIITFLFVENPVDSIKKSILFASKQEVVYAAMAFTYMAFVMEKTGIIERLVTILNSFLGKFSGGSAYVSTIASALFGMISGSGSGNAAAVGSITIPWMKNTGFDKEISSTIVAGNAGLGITFPPSSSMFLLLGMPVIASELTAESLYVTLLSAALILLIIRLIISYYFVKKYNIKPIESSKIIPLKESLKNNWTSLTIFLGVIIPIFLTSGKIKNFLVNSESFGKAANKSISLIIWIPLLITIITLIEGRNKIPKKFSDFIKFNAESIFQYGQTGILLFFAFASSRILINLGLEREINSIFEILSNHSKFIVIIAISILITFMVGPFTGTAATTAIGSIGYIALRSIGLAPSVACTVLLLLFSNEGCIPPNSAPIYIACGISELEDPSKIFKNLIFLYALPTIILAILISLKIIPIL